MEENKKTLSNYVENKLINHSLIKDEELSYIIKKTDRIATAIYMISNFFTIEEPLKWELRKIVTKLIKNIMSYNDSSLSYKEIISSKVFSDLMELNTYFNLAYNSGFISSMNYQLVSNEISALASVILNYSEKQSFAGKAIFSKDYFTIKKETTAQNKPFIKDIVKDIVKDNLKDTNRSIKDTIKDNVVFKGQKSEIDPFFNGAMPQSKISEREQKIIDLVKKAGSVIVKDIANHFPDVSEKTIQRELNKLVESGQIHKEGERRWTRYFI